MKHLFKLGCVVLLTCLIACNKDKFKPEDYSQGHVVALLNGETWETSGSGIFLSDDTFVSVSFVVFNDAGLTREALGFSGIPLQQGMYSLGTKRVNNEDSLVIRTSYLTLISDGDVIGDVYKLVEGGSFISSLTVESYDETSRILKGGFNAKYLRDPSFPLRNPDSPDTLLFEMGEFEVQIEE